MQLFSSSLKTAALTLVFLSPFAPGLAHAQVAASLTGDGVVHAGSSTGSASGGIQVGVDTPLIVTRASAKANVEATGAAITATSATDDRATLETKANSIASADTHVSSVTLSSKDVAVSYREPAKFLGVIGATVPVTIRVTADGSAHISYPWYSFLFSSNQAGLTIRAQAAAKNALDADATSSGELSTAEQARILDSIHSVLESSVEANASEESAIQP